MDSPYTKNLRNSIAYKKGEYRNSQDYSPYNLEEEEDIDLNLANIPRLGRYDHFDDFDDFNRNAVRAPHAVEYGEVSFEEAMNWRFDHNQSPGRPPVYLFSFL